ncbi:hypothetical protein LAZ67_X004698 [Cordylochernes scorpioides]|uniref:Uncharacterized protein n=1 Tax=Cordylochernes scorpioides TaxID=51811 RepID=A0ABY6LV62_9ARAC|nr:hypothetical protein LAZ67_X004698 [Cordylochernes scorpioides]
MEQQLPARMSLDVTGVSFTSHQLSAWKSGVINCLGFWAKRWSISLEIRLYEDSELRLMGLLRLHERIRKVGKHDCFTPLRRLQMDFPSMTDYTCPKFQKGIYSIFSSSSADEMIVVNVLDSGISKTNADLGVIRDKFSKLKDIDFKLKDLDQKMLDHMMVADAEEDTLNCEIEEAEHYSDTFITLERKVRELIDSDNKSDVKSLGSSNGSLMAKSYKLPKIEIIKFDGELINWLPFWAQFEKIHEDTELHDADKFHYLVQSMQSNTRARELIESYPQTAENYAKAVQALKQRYGQKDLLVEIYVRELLKLMMANVKTPPDERRSVAKLYD